MKTKRELVIVRGGGDIATGTIQALKRAGYDVLILETEKPSAIRRQVALSEAVYDGTSTVEDVTCVYCHTDGEARLVMDHGNVALMIDADGDSIKKWKPCAVIDAILAKRNVGTKRAMAPITIGLGPGFTAGDDVDVVIETMRGHNLGRIIREGCALPNTGTPGIIAGYGKERVVHAGSTGHLHNLSHIGDSVAKGQAIATIVGADGSVYPVLSPLTGLLRGLIRDGYYVTKGLKIADVDPRQSEYKNCFTISDKARCIGGAVVTALLSMQRGVSQHEVNQCKLSLINNTTLHKQIV